jgi:hypothetical protein
MGLSPNPSLCHLHLTQVPVVLCLHRMPASVHLPLFPLKKTSLQFVMVKKKKKKRTWLVPRECCQPPTFVPAHGPTPACLLWPSMAQPSIATPPLAFHRSFSAVVHGCFHCRSTALSHRSLLPAGIHSGLLLTVTVQTALRIRADLCCSRLQIFHLTTVNTKCSFVALRR